MESQDIVLSLPYLTSLQVVDVFTTMATRSAAASLPPTQSPRQRDQSKPHLHERERDTGGRGYSVLESLLPQYKYSTIEAIAVYGLWLTQ